MRNDWLWLQRFKALILSHSLSFFVYVILCVNKMALKKNANIILFCYGYFDAFYLMISFREFEFSFRYSDRFKAQLCFRIFLCFLSSFVLNSCFDYRIHRNENVKFHSPRKSQSNLKTKTSVNTTNQVSNTNDLFPKMSKRDKDHGYCVAHNV